MIKSFRDNETQQIANGRRSRYLPPDIQANAFRKLTTLQAAISLKTLAALPGNHLEALSRDRKGQHSIRINKQ